MFMVISVVQAKENQKIATKLAKTPEAKKKRKQVYNEIKHQQGENNSQFGKFWISNRINPTSSSQTSRRWCKRNFY